MANTKENLFILTPLNFKEINVDNNTERKSVDVGEYVDKYDPSVFCRTCANTDPYLVPIFKEEGLSYNLDEKIRKYLPIHVSQEDDLPVHLCYNCASTLIAWDTLIIGCVEAEKKLNLLKNSLENKQCDEVVNVDTLINGNIDSDDEPLIVMKSSEQTDKVEERRDILPEKNDFQALFDEVGLETERLLEEPDLSFSNYQRQFATRRPLFFEIFSLRIESVFCCNICTALGKVKERFLKSSTTLKEKEESVDEGSGKKVKSKRRRSKSKDQIVCENCGKVLPCKISWKNHMRNHKKEKSLACQQCGKVFSHRFNLLRHLRVVHEGVKNHVCTDCGKRYRSQSEMEDHRNVHGNTRGEEIVCEECGRMYVTKSSFYSHRKLHKKMKSSLKRVVYSCEECQKSFTTKKSKIQHKLIHTGEKPIECSTCGKNFRTKGGLDQHSKVHTNVKPFVCEHCGKAFGRRSHLKIHVRCHTGEKPYACGVCGKGFAQIGDMKKHKKIHEKVR